MECDLPGPYLYHQRTQKHSGCEPGQLENLFVPWRFLGSLMWPQIGLSPGDGGLRAKVVLLQSAATNPLGVTLQQSGLGAGVDQPCLAL